MYKPKAQVVGDEILEVFPNAEVILEVGHGGQFDVIYEGDSPELLFSKESFHPPRFPESGEIVNKLK